MLRLLRQRSFARACGNRLSMLDPRVAHLHTWRMIDRLGFAVEALNQGDPAPFASLFEDNAEWRGVSRGVLWWKHAPS